MRGSAVVVTVAGGDLIVGVDGGQGAVLRGALLPSIALTQPRHGPLLLIIITVKLHAASVVLHVVVFAC
jgi:hypothetical protein